MARQYQDVGGYVNETGTRQYQDVGGYRNETSGSGSALTLELTDTISFSDSPIKDASKVLSDAITLAEAIAKLMGKPLSDSLTILDSLSKLSGKSLSETVSLADSVVKDFGKVFSDSLSLSDSIDVSILLTSALADAFSVTDSISMLLRPGSVGAAGISLPTLGICSDESTRTGPATFGICSTESRRTTPATLGCGSATRRTGLATTGCVTVTQRQNESVSDGGGDDSGSVEIQLLIVDGFVVSDTMRVIGTFVDPPTVEGCTDEFPGAYWGTYAWALTEFQDPNIELTGQQIACAVELLTVQASEEPSIAGKTLGIMFWKFFADPENLKSGVAKAESDNCDPNNPEGNVDVDFNSGHWQLAIAVCVNS